MRGWLEAWRQRRRALRTALEDDSADAGQVVDDFDRRRADPVPPDFDVTEAVDRGEA